jgi:hypothetical protein
MIYTDTIIPETQSLYDSMMRQWGLHEQGYYLEADFHHLPVMQDDEVASQQVVKTKVDAYSILLKDGIISKQQYADEFGVTLEAVDKVQAQNDGLFNAQTQLRGTIGGLDGIISLNSAVGTGQMTRDVAIATLVNYYGYDVNIAQQMITESTQQINGNN